MTYGFEWYTSIAVLTLFFSLPVIASWSSRSSFNGMSFTGILGRLLGNLGKTVLMIVLGFIILFFFYFLTRMYILMLGMAPVVFGLLYKFFFVSNESTVEPRFEVGGFRKMVEPHDKVIEVEPDNAYIWNSNGNVLRNSGRLEEALQAYDKSLEIEPNYFQSWVGKGYALKNLGRPEEAIEAYDKVIKIKPELQNIWYDKALLLHKLGKDQEAVKTIDDGLNKSKNSSMLKEFRTELQIRLGDISGNDQTRN
jgi:tetratricopeptide (TPR) repeat protein